MIIEKNLEINLINYEYATKEGQQELDTDKHRLYNF